MPTELRRAEPTDLEILLPLVRDYHAFERIDNDNQHRRDALEVLLQESPYGGIWLIYADQQLAGYIALCRGFSIEFGGFDAFIDEFFLAREYRGRGIGKQVLQLIKQEARKLEIHALHLEVAHDNEPARRLYLNAGFETREKYSLMSAELD